MLNPAPNFSDQKLKISSLKQVKINYKTSLHISPVIASSSFCDGQNINFIINCMSVSLQRHLKYICVYMSYELDAYLTVTFLKSSKLTKMIEESHIETFVISHYLSICPSLCCSSEIKYALCPDLFLLLLKLP